jgi:hypothetical protein
MGSYLALQFCRDIWEYIISETAQKMVHDLVNLARRNRSGTFHRLAVQL